MHQWRTRRRPTCRESTTCPHETTRQPTSACWSSAPSLRGPSVAVETTCNFLHVPRPMCRLLLDLRRQGSHLVRPEHPPLHLPASRNQVSLLQASRLLASRHPLSLPISSRLPASRRPPSRFPQLHPPGELPQLHRTTRHVYFLFISICNNKYK